jgi:hypothetical protein
MTREELIKKVALKMDEISSSDDVIISVGIDDNNPLYAQIDSLLNESVNEVLMKVPVHRTLGHVDVENRATVEEIFNSNRKIAKIPVPNDFLKLVAIKDIAFNRPITVLATEGDDMDRKQHNRFLVAKQSKPVGVLITSDEPSGDPQRFIICYSYDNSSTPSPTMLYIHEYNKTERDGDTELDTYLTDVVTWVCAGKVFSAQGDIAKSQACDANAVAIMS